MRKSLRQALEFGKIAPISKEEREKLLMSGQWKYIESKRRNR